MYFIDPKPISWIGSQRTVVKADETFKDMKQTFQPKLLKDIPKKPRSKSLDFRARFGAIKSASKTKEYLSKNSMNLLRVKNKRALKLLVPKSGSFYFSGNSFCQLPIFQLLLGNVAKTSRMSLSHCLLVLLLSLFPSIFPSKMGFPKLSLLFKWSKYFSFCSFIKICNHWSSTFSSSLTDLFVPCFVHDIFKIFLQHFISKALIHVSQPYAAMRRTHALRILCFAWGSWPFHKNFNFESLFFAIASLLLISSYPSPPRDIVDPT